MPPHRSSGKKGTRTNQKQQKKRTQLKPTTVNSRSTATHVCFWGGILSNWCLTSPAFSGARCLEIMLPKLDELDIAHPPRNALSTQILAAHDFMCGEQWMMAVKAWLFERTSDLGETLVNQQQDSSSDGMIGKQQFKLLKSAVIQDQPPSDFTPGTKERALYDGTLYAILQASTPRTQKSLGRKVSGFDERVWNKASISVVVASCVARAEADPALRTVYQEGVSRTFVEGSPVDRIWGVGLKWDNPLIEDEVNWRGQNRLGKCHDAAAKHINEKFGGMR